MWRTLLRFPEVLRASFLSSFSHLVHPLSMFLLYYTYISMSSKILKNIKNFVKKRGRSRISASGPFSILCIKHPNASASSPAPLFQNSRTGRISAHTVYFRENLLCENLSYRGHPLHMSRYNSVAVQP